MIEEINLYENNYKIFMQETFDTRQSQLKKKPRIDRTQYLQSSPTILDSMF